ncbi:MAG: SHOCT domain-containing protein [Acidimicrobiia bacterium]|nr:SHOCT domain-containing protein [Acidimicrobiia bacterium]
MWSTLIGSLPAHRGDHDHMWGDGWGWMWLLGTVVMVALVGLAVAALVWGARAGRAPGAGDGRARARDILAERYARGEITTEEYRERLQELG